MRHPTRLLPILFLTLFTLAASAAGPNQTERRQTASKTLVHDVCPHLLADIVRAIQGTFQTAILRTFHTALDTPAQGCFDWCWQQVGTDVHGLDSDGDRVACESLPRGWRVVGTGDF